MWVLQAKKELDFFGVLQYNNRSGRTLKKE